MTQNPRYPVILRPLNDEDGGGWIAIVPDLPGCMSDGATGEEAFKNALDAIESWEEVAREDGAKPPPPDSFLAQMQFVVPNHLRPQLEDLARKLEASSDEHISREQIMAGLMYRLATGQGFGVHH